MKPCPHCLIVCFLLEAASSALASAADRARGLLANLALAGLDMEVGPMEQRHTHPNAAASPI